jgi:hypothetical protein
LAPGIDVDQPLRHLARMRCGVANALDAGNFGDVFDQQREVGRFITGERLPAAGMAPR